MSFAKSTGVDRKSALSGGAPEPRDVTAWLDRWGWGDSRAIDAILPEVYDELRRIGRRVLAGERHDHTLQTTALVHEAYLRLLDQRKISARNRNEFFALAGLTMRRILVDHARSLRRKKRGGGLKRVPLDSAERWLDAGQLAELEILDGLLDRLADLDPRAALVVQHRFFVGLDSAEIAELLGVSIRTVKRDWALARSWLRREVRLGIGD